jgi:D-glycero-D-manno-heptose 1,7-bisphosphate phosphatase
MKRRAVFLDRDGVINRAAVRDGKPYPPDPSQPLEILEGVSESLAALRARGFLLIVVTNQPDVARGTANRETVQRVHQHLLSELPLDAIFACFHDDHDGCDCRKPQPGLLLSAARELGVDLTLSFMIGDRWRDMEAGTRAGCATIFIDHQYAERQPDAFGHRVSGLSEARAIILAERIPAPQT